MAKQKLFAGLNTAINNAIEEIHAELIEDDMSAEEIDQIWDCDTVIWDDRYGYLLNITNVANFVACTKIAINTEKFVQVVVCYGQGIA